MDIQGQIINQYTKELEKIVKENKIDSWIYVESGGQLTGKPSASLGEQNISNIRRVRPPYSNNIITYIKEKIKT